MKKILLVMALMASTFGSNAADEYVKVDLNYVDYDSFGYLIRTEGRDDDVRHVVLLVPGVVMLNEESGGVRYSAADPLVKDMDRFVNQKTVVVLIDVPTSVWWSGRVNEYLASNSFAKNIGLVLKKIGSRFPSATIGVCGKGGLALAPLGFSIDERC